MSKKQITLIDTYNSGLEYSDYVEFCEANEITPEPEGSNDYYEWLAEENNRYVEDFFENLRYVNFYTPVIITGSLGLWNGRKEIYPVVVESSGYDYNERSGKFEYKQPSLYNAVKKCINGMDDFKVELSEGQIVVHGYHHDGTNIFTISKLTNKSINSVLKAVNEGKHLQVKNYWIGKITETDLWG
jgi:hypothetical protein